uniref:ZFAND2A/B-like C2H2 zinc finger domain-containing protein n=1 Tax=Timema shepardi TaxID=629360 RepID=A0A7R9ALM6_TIMSH|nr:unnamed protein product [Timema shepardi]
MVTGLLSEQGLVVPNFSLHVFGYVAPLKGKEHMVYSCHNCPSACQKDVQVPLCPLCNAPVLVGPGEQPDKVVREHIEQDCQAISAIDRRKNDSASCVLRDNLKQAHLSSLVEVPTTPHLQEHTKLHSDSRLIVQDILETAIKSMLDNVAEASFCDTNAVPVQQNSKVCSTNVCSPQNLEENVKSQQPVPEVVSEVGLEALPNCSLGSFELPDDVKSKKDSGKSNNITKENETDSSFLGEKKIEAELKQIPVTEKESSISFLLKTEPSSTPIDSNQPSKLSDSGKHESVEADAKQVLDLRVLKDTRPRRRLACQTSRALSSLFYRVSECSSGGFEPLFHAGPVDRRMQ